MVIHQIVTGTNSLGWCLSGLKSLTVSFKSHDGHFFWGQDCVNINL